MLQQFEVLYCRKGGFELFSAGALRPRDMVIDPNEVHHTPTGENQHKFAPRPCSLSTRFYR